MFAMFTGSPGRLRTLAVSSHDRRLQYMMSTSPDLQLAQYILSVSQSTVNPEHLLTFFTRVGLTLDKLTLGSSVDLSNNNRYKQAVRTNRRNLTEWCKSSTPMFTEYHIDWHLNINCTSSYTLLNYTGHYHKHASTGHMHG